MVADGQQLTFAEVNERANRLAHHLRALGVGPEDLVGVCLERGPELVPTLLGVLKSGAGYLPLDPANPSDRLGYVLADSGAKVAVVHAATRPLLAEVFAGELVDAERLTGSSPRRPGPTRSATPSRWPARTAPSTSSTPPARPASPRASWSPHANVVRLLRARPTLRSASAPRTCGRCSTRYAFDFSVWEIWGAAAARRPRGDRPRPGGPRPASSSWTCCAEQGVTVLNQTPSAFGQLIRADGTAAAERRRPRCAR